MKIVNIVGARPNFMKIAPVIREMKRFRGIESLLIHTGQHYNGRMSDVFFKDLGLPAADINLNVGSGSQAIQTARIMVRLEKVLVDKKPDLAVVVGDVNSTLAASLVCSKLLIPIAHIESGLRSFDRKMPEEINRITTDVLSDYLFTTSKEAGLNLRKEGIPKEKIFFVGNVMIDTLKSLRAKAASRETYRKLGYKHAKYALITLHRPSNVDDDKSFRNMIKALKEVAKLLPVIFPVHPRARKKIASFGFRNSFKNSALRLIQPQGYLDFLNLMMNSKLVLTDSGGVQEETTALNIPCLTLRHNTERPVTVEEGTNTVVGDDKRRIVSEVRKILSGKYKNGKLPQLWDGKAAKRIVNIINTRLRK